MAKGSEWTDEEFEAAVAAYFEMLEHQNAGEAYSKAAINQRLRDGALHKRSKSSVEFRMQNISAVFKALELKTVNGYVPAKNVGPRGTKKIKAAVARYLENQSQPTADLNELNAKTDALRRAAMTIPPKGQSNVKRTNITTQAYFRDPQVRAWVLENANGKCEGCGNDAPFTTETGYPFLEVHHVIWLSQGGEDTIENSVALCPNCHRRCHNSADREEFKKELYASTDRLKHQKSLTT